MGLFGIRYDAGGRRLARRNEGRFIKEQGVRGSQSLVS